MNWLSAITAVSRLFGALTGLFRDWQLRRAGAKDARLAPSSKHSPAPNGYRKLRRIWIVLMTMSLTAACASIDAPVAGCEWIRPIILTDDDVLTRETKLALLRHNETWSEFCN